MFQFEKRVIGLDLGTATVKLSHVRAGKQGLELLGAAIVRLPDGAIDESGIADVELVAGGIKEALQEAGVGRRTRQVVAGIPGKHLTVRVLSVPTMDHAELREAVKWEAAQYLPYPVEEAVFDFVELGPGAGPGTLEVLSISTRRSVVESTVKSVELAGLEPIALDAVPLALGRAFIPESDEYRLSFGDLQAAATREGHGESAVAIVDVGSANTDVSIFRAGRLRVGRSIPIGGARFTAAIAGALGLSADAAEGLKITKVRLGPEEEQGESRDAAAANALRGVAEELAHEIQRSLDYFRAQSHWLPVDHLILTGDGGRLSGLSGFLAEQLGMSVGVGDLKTGALAGFSGAVDSKRVSPVSLGLALWEVNRA